MPWGSKITMESIVNKQYNNAGFTGEVRGIALLWRSEMIPLQITLPWIKACAVGKKPQYNRSKQAKLLSNVNGSLLCEFCVMRCADQRKATLATPTAMPFINHQIRTLDWLGRGYKTWPPFAWVISRLRFPIFIAIMNEGIVGIEWFPMVECASSAL